MARKYQVLIDDNYHTVDDSGPIKAGSFRSLEDAIVKCVRITIRSLDEFYEAGIGPQKLSAQWALFGDDPYVVGDGGAVPYSARNFITEGLCQAIIDSKQAEN